MPRATPAASMRSSRTAATSPSVRRIRRFLASGAIGAPTSIHCRLLRRPAFRRLPRGDAPCAAARHGDPHLRRGALHGDRPEPHGVYCHEWEPANSWYQQGSSAAADLRDGAAACVFTYRGSWCADGFRTSWEAAWRIVGERGTLIWDGFDDIRAEVATGGRDGLFDNGEPVERAAARPARPHRRPSRRHPGFRRARSQSGTRARDRAAPTTSRAWRWSSARSRAPRPAAASRSRREGAR